MWADRTPEKKSIIWRPDPKASRQGAHKQAGAVEVWWEPESGWGQQGQVTGEVFQVASEKLPEITRPVLKILSV